MDRIAELLRLGGVADDRRVVIDAEVTHPPAPPPPAADASGVPQVLYTADGHSGPPPPFVARSVSSEATRQADHALSMALRNELGEYDVAHTFYVRSLPLQSIAGEGGFRLDTVDTDILFVALLQSSIAGYADKVRVSCTLAPGCRPHDFDPNAASRLLQGFMGPDAPERLAEVS